MDKSNWLRCCYNSHRTAAERRAKRLTSTALCSTNSQTVSTTEVHRLTLCCLQDWLIDQTELILSFSCLLTFSSICQCHHTSSVLWHCWFGHITCKHRPRYDLLCVWWDVKPSSLTYSHLRCRFEQCPSICCK